MILAFILFIKTVKTIPMSQVIKNLQKEFYHYKALGDRTFEQLAVDQMNWKSSSESTSI